MRILVAAGPNQDTIALARAFRQHAFAVFNAFGADDALCYLDTTGADLVVASLGGGRGADNSMLREIRRSARAPILAVTGDDSPAARNRALTLGADVAISHPCSIREIVARASTLLRRARGFSSDTLVSGDVSIGMLCNGVRFGGRLAALTRMEYAFLRTLVLNRDRIVPREELMLCLYGSEDAPFTKILDSYCCRVRGHMSRVNPRMVSRIETAPGRGYVFRPNPASEPRVLTDIKRLAALRAHTMGAAAIAAE